MVSQSKSVKKSAKSAVSSTPVTTTASAPAPSAPVVQTFDPTKVTQCTSLLGQVDTLLGPVTSLSASDIRRMLKLRRSGPPIVQQLIDLCVHHGITGVGPVTVATMTTELDRVKALNQVGVELAALQKHFSDATFASESVTWQNATAFYTVLQRLAVMDPDLAAGLQPVQAAFQTVATKGLKRTNAKARKRTAAQNLLASDPSVTTPAASAPATTATPAAPVNVTSGAQPAPPVTATPSVSNGAAHS